MMTVGVVECKCSKSYLIARSELILKECLEAFVRMLGRSIEKQVVLQQVHYVMILFRFALSYDVEIEEQQLKEDPSILAVGSCARYEYIEKEMLFFLMLNLCFESKIGRN